MKKSELYAVNAFKFDSEIFPILLEAKPCLILTSILDEASKTACLRFLHEFKQYRISQGYPARDPALRIVVVAKNRQAASTNWPELGVYELMIAPVPTNVLIYKLSRHHQKALSAENQKSNLKLVEENKMTEIFRSEASVKETEWKVFQVPSSESPLAEAVRTERKIQKIEIEVKLPDIRPDQGEWISGDSSEAVEKKWEWMTNEIARQPATASRRATYFGEKPMYQPSRETWQFTGEKPRLTEFDPKVGPPPKELFRTLLEVNQKPSVQARPAIEIQLAKQKVYLDVSPEDAAEAPTAESSSRRLGFADQKKPHSDTQCALPEISPSGSPRLSTPSEMRNDRSRTSKDQVDQARPEIEKLPQVLPKVLPSLEVEVPRPTSGEAPVSHSTNRKNESQPPASIQTKPIHEGGVTAPDIQQKNRQAKAEAVSMTTEKEKGRSIRELSSMDPSSSSSQTSDGPNFFQSAPPSKEDPRAATLHTHSEKTSVERSLGDLTASREKDPSYGSTESSADTLSGASGMSIQLKEEKGQKEDRVASNESRLSSPEPIVSALESLHGQRQFEEGSFTSQSTDESYSSTSIRADEEESFWSILYDDDEGDGARNQKKKKPESGLQGWNLKLIKKNTPQSRKLKRGGQAHMDLNRTPAKETLFERILRFIRQLLDLS